MSTELTYELRIVQRLDGDNWNTVRLSDIKEDDIFRLFESDLTTVGDYWKATSDAAPDPNHEGLGMVMADPYIID